VGIVVDLRRQLRRYRGDRERQGDGEDGDGPRERPDHEVRGGVPEERSACGPRVRARTASAVALLDAAGLDHRCHQVSS
jgi:hypothetical protein